MHPVIRIVCYLVLAVFLARANLAQLLFSALLLGALLFVARPAHFAARLARTLYRLKWLFLSILVLYAWFAPDPGSAQANTWFDPAALQAGLFRVAVLILLIWGVLFMLNDMSRAQLLGAVYFLLLPLRKPGIEIERFALRLALTLEAVNELQAQRPAKNSTDAGGSAWQRIIASVNYWFEYVRERAESTPLQPQALPARMGPPSYQWAYPALLATVFVALQFINSGARI